MPVKVTVVAVCFESCFPIVALSVLPSSSVMDGVGLCAIEHFFLHATQFCSFFRLEVMSSGWVDVFCYAVRVERIHLCSFFVL